MNQVDAGGTARKAHVAAQQQDTHINQGGNGQLRATRPSRSGSGGLCGEGIK